MIIEKWWRSGLKMLTWRILATITLGLVTLILTGSLAATGVLLSVDIILKTILYYIHERAWSKSNIGRTLKEKEGCVVWFFGISGSGKTTLADEVARRLKKKGIQVKRIDGDVARTTFSSDLGFSKKDRDENNKRAAYAASWGAIDSIVLASFISPYRLQREYTRSICDNYLEVFVDCPINICEARDPKGLYKKVRAGEIKSFTGIHNDAPFEKSNNYDLRVDTYKENLNQSTNKVIKLLKEAEVI